MVSSILSDPIKFCLLIAFLHVFADFNLQIGGRLNEFKCKMWWMRLFRDQHDMPFGAACRKYGRDYIVGLVLHSFAWSFVTFLPLYARSSCSGVEALVIVGANAAFHVVVDHLKANLMRITLVTDQLLHLVQIAVTVAAYWHFS